MEKFSKMKVDKSPQEDKIVYKDDHLSIINFDDWNILKEKDGVICIPYLIESNQIVIRQEYIPSYKYADGQENHLALVGGGIEAGETPEVALLRELQEEAGIVLRQDFRIEFDKPLYIGKHSCGKFYSLILPLNESDYHEIVIKGDGSRFEDMATTAKINVKYLNSLNTSDVITEYMLEKLKRYLNI